MKAAEMKKKSAQDLNKELTDLWGGKFNLRMKKGMGQLAKPSALRSVRRSIARVKTVLNETAGKAS